MNWYKIFYWMTVADGMKKFFETTSNIFTFFSVVLIICFIVSVVGSALQTFESKIKSDEEAKVNPALRGWNIFRRYSIPAMYIYIGLALFTWIGYAAIPSQKDALIIITGGAVGNFITSDSSAKQIPAEAMTLLRDKIREEIKTVNFGSVINSGEDSLKVKTRDELIQMIKDKNK